jgi:GAF domain-containing protein
MKFVSQAPNTWTPKRAEDAARVYQHWRERFVRPMLFAALAFGLIALILTLTANRSVLESTVFVVAYLLLLIVTLVPTPYWLRIGVFLLVVYSQGVSELLSTGILGRAGFFFVALIVFATLMLSDRAGVVSLVLTILTFIVVGSLVETGNIRLLSAQALAARPIDWISVSATMILFAGTLILGLRQLMLEFLETQAQSTETLRALQSERSTLESRVQARTNQLTAVNEVGRVASSILNPEELALRVANLITEQFGYYYAAIFLVDESGQDAWLHSATGEAGRVLKENRHHLRVGGNSMVGMAISTAKPRVALDVGAEPVRFENPLLPYTRSEIAVPLTLGEQVLGALDVQSTKAGAFGPQEIETLQAMANQLAIAIENARLFESAEKSLEEMQSVQRQYVLDAWTPYSNNESLDYKLGEEVAPPNSSRLTIPMSLRDQTIGEIDLAGDAEWTAEQRNLIETVAGQAALALENARLVTQSQASARREHELAEITGRIWAAPTIDGILQTAVQELGQALEASEALIELNMGADHER